MKGKKTYAGIIIFGLATVFGWLGLGGDAEATQIYEQGAQFLGTLLALYGRWDATRTK
jgi:hypothetical protein